MKKIQLSQNKIALIDDEDIDYISQWKWSYQNAGYAVRNDKGRILLMHRELLTVNKKESVDHINGNTLDNRKCNLRICSHKENLRNQKISKNNTSGYKGVSWFKARKKWAAQISVDKKHIHLGLFINKEDAAKAYNKASIKYFGSFAKVNKI